MRSNAMKKCAVGAMLFGGTLGLSQAASAGVNVTWSASNAFNTGSAYNLFLQSSYEVYEFRLASTDPSVAAFGSTTYTLGGTSATFTNTASGFAMSGSGGPASAVAASRNFTIAGLGNGETLTATVVLASLPMFNGSSSFIGSGSFIIQKAGVESWEDVAGGGGSAAGTYSVQLGNGSYYISMGIGNGDVVGAIPSLNGTFASFIVPAPGAMALLGAAGLVGGRRRRA